jgi:hypothetical protein
MKQVTAALKYQPTDAERRPFEQGVWTIEQANLFLAEEARSPDEALALISHCIHVTNFDTALHLIKEVDWKTTLLAQVEAELTTHGLGKVRFLTSIFADMLDVCRAYMLIRISAVFVPRHHNIPMVTPHLDEYYPFALTLHTLPFITAIGNIHPTVGEVPATCILGR